MKKIQFLVLGLTAFATVSALGACDVEQPTASAATPDRVPLGKADALAGSCMTDDADFCGGQSADGCWCDEACESFGDCCGDVDAACGVGPACPDPDDPAVHYISQELLHCAAIFFACEDGQTGFSNECGCGCVDDESEPEPEPGPECGDETCGAGETCVETMTMAFSTFKCVSIPQECDGEATCGCMGDQVCGGLFNACVEQQGGLNCSCPIC